MRASAAAAAADGRHPTTPPQTAVPRPPQVNAAALPPGISPALASSIEFVGKAVRLLRSPAGAEEGQVLLPFEDQLAWAAALGELQRQPRFSEGALERAVEVMRADVSRGRAAARGRGADEGRALAGCAEAARAQRARPQMERGRARVRRGRRRRRPLLQVAARLWHLLVVRAGLMAHLGGVKDYLLLARCGRLPGVGVWAGGRAQGAWAAAWQTGVSHGRLLELRQRPRRGSHPRPRASPCPSNPPRTAAHPEKPHAAHAQ
jgi:hypothetical protein